MKGKLIKTDDEYRLYLDDVLPYATSDNSPYKRLSKQNCDEIFGVVDAGKLAEEEIPYSSSTTINVQRMRFIHGFNKAMELNKDKLFSQEDMYKMFIYGDSIITAKKHVNTLKNKPLDEFFNDFIQSLQQPTEIEVEIEMTCDGVQTGLCMPEICDCNIIPRLDEERCLILKRL
jgi:hypothetical protein